LLHTIIICIIIKLAMLRRYLWKLHQ
jgi:hypothetical protein